MSTPVVDIGSRAGRGLTSGPAAKGESRRSAFRRLSPAILYWTTGFVLSAALHGALIYALVWRTSP